MKTEGIYISVILWNIARAVYKYIFLNLVFHILIVSFADCLCWVFKFQISICLLKIKKSIIRFRREMLYMENTKELEVMVSSVIFLLVYMLSWS